jgi:hypothetical protein
MARQVVQDLAPWPMLLNMVEHWGDTVDLGG